MSDPEGSPDGIPADAKGRAPEKVEAFLKMSPDGWLTLSVPVNIRDGDIMAFGILRKAEMLVADYLDRRERMIKERGLVLP
jgi:hypothetical protein